MSPNLVILAGGISSRMKRSVAAAGASADGALRDALEKPKAMIGVGSNGRPLLDYLLLNALEAGYRNVAIVVGEGQSSIQNYYGRSGTVPWLPGLTISYAVQKVPSGRSKPLGTADALREALASRIDWRGETFTVCNSDNLYSTKALRALLETPFKGALIDYDRDALRFPPDRIAQFAVIRKTARGFLADIIEKPSPEQIAACADANRRVGVSMNIFRFSYDVIAPILEQVPVHPVRQEKEIPTAVMMMVGRDPEAMMTIPLSETVPDLTCMEDIATMRKILEREFPDLSV